MRLIPISSQYPPFFYQNIEFLSKIQKRFNSYQNRISNMFNLSYKHEFPRITISSELKQMFWNDRVYLGDYYSRFYILPDSNKNKNLISVFGISIYSLLLITSSINQNFYNKHFGDKRTSHSRINKYGLVFKDLCKTITNISYLDELRNDKIEINIPLNHQPSIKESCYMSFNRQYFKMEHITGTQLPSKTELEVVIEHKNENNDHWSIADSPWIIMKLADNVFQLTAYIDGQVSICIISFEE